QYLKKITTNPVICDTNMKPKRKKTFTEVDSHGSIYRGEHVDV
ncbi:capsule biosynthesis protein CapK, partial [Bacillus paranthracis]|nr:capsule biosynthesis protein CapK [Bacillus paranthracis]